PRLERGRRFGRLTDVRYRPKADTLRIRIRSGIASDPGPRGGRDMRRRIGMIPPWSDCLAIRLSHALSRSQSDGWYRRTITTPRLPRVGYSGLAVWSNQH